MISVIIPTHNPDARRLRRTLEGLRSQTLPPTEWQTVLVDNASTEFPNTGEWHSWAPDNCQAVHESELGLTQARRCGILASQGEILVLVDDDNVLAPDYLEKVLAAFSCLPQVGLLGGRSIPEFEGPAEPWIQEFLPLLALRDLGDQRLISSGLRPPGSKTNEYPAYAPIGAGMALRTAAASAWIQALRTNPSKSALDRRGKSLVSGGDNDIVLTAMSQGWEVAYCPELVLNHLIPATRLTTGYLSRLNCSLQESWMRVLSMHDANPWPPLTPFGCRIRQWKAWFHHQPWRCPARRVRYAGVRGHFSGRVP